MVRSADAAVGGVVVAAAEDVAAVEVVAAADLAGAGGDALRRF